ncbi:MAG: hypothetical protein GXO39_04245 [Thermotogae bacterium]|nr:hypothetical protein [Thermotogota bacterium]
MGFKYLEFPYDFTSGGDYTGKSIIEPKEGPPASHGKGESIYSAAPARGIEDIVEWFDRFTDGKKEKVTALVGITLQESGGRYFGRTKVRSVHGVRSSAAGYMQCTRTFIKDVLQDSYSRGIIEDLLKAMFREKDVSRFLNVDTLYALQQQAQTAAVGLLLGYAGFELGMKRYGKYPLIGIAHHLQPAAAAAIEKSGLISRLRSAQNFKHFEMILSRIRDWYDSRAWRTVVRAHDTGKRKLPFTPITYIMGVLKKMRGAGEAIIGRPFSEKEVISMVTSSVAGYSPSSWAQSILSGEALISDGKNAVSFYPVGISFTYDQKRMEEESLLAKLTGKHSTLVCSTPDSAEEVLSLPDDYSLAAGEDLGEKSAHYARVGQRLRTPKKCQILTGGGRVRNEQETPLR